MLLTEYGPVQIDAPRDRNGSFEPQIVRKRQRRFEGGLTRRSSRSTPVVFRRGISKRTSPRSTVSKSGGIDQQGHRRGHGRRPLLAEQAARGRLPRRVPDCMVLKICDGGSVQRRACYLALAIGIDGEREVLAMWFQANEGAKF
jgi:putative transposase